MADVNSRNVHCLLFLVDLTFALIACLVEIFKVMINILALFFNRLGKDYFYDDSYLENGDFEDAKVSTAVDMDDRFKLLFASLSVNSNTLRTENLEKIKVKIQILRMNLLLSSAEEEL